MTTIFTKLINRTWPAYFIKEDENYAAFLDARPLTKGHTLVVPKREVDYFFDLDEATYLGLMQFARPIALALKKAVVCQRVAVAVLGLEVPHAHLHLVPIEKESDLIFSKARKQFSPSEFSAIANTIKAQLD